MLKNFLMLSLLAGFAAQEAQATLLVYEASLDGPSEKPPVASPATGFTTVSYNDVAHTLRVEVTFSGLLGGTTAAHIHCCVLPPDTVGVATTTPTFPLFPTGATSGSYDSTFDLTLASSFNPTFVTNSGGTPAGAEAALAAGLAAGEAYLNIHTSAFPAGEIRGFLQPVAIPEPATALLLGGGLLLSLRKRQS